MKGIEIKNADSNFAMFLMAVNVVFIYNYGTFTICDTNDIVKFQNFCRSYGVAEALISKMEMSVVDVPELNR